MLLLGQPGSGKSRLAHQVIDRGHQLVADDIVDVQTNTDGTLSGTAPETLYGMLHLRHAGLFNIAEIFGLHALCKRMRIDLAVTLDPNMKIPAAILATPVTDVDIGNQKIPGICLNLSQEKHPASILELLVKQFSQELLVPRRNKTNIISAVNSV